MCCAAGPVTVARSLYVYCSLLLACEPQSITFGRIKLTPGGMMPSQLATFVDRKHGKRIVSPRLVPPQTNNRIAHKLAK